MEETKKLPKAPTKTEFYLNQIYDRLQVLETKISFFQEKLGQLLEILEKAEDTMEDEDEENLSE